MSTYKIQLILQNPLTGDNETMTYKFDPATLDQTKWNTAFPAVKARLDALVAASGVAGKEPTTW